MSARLCLLGAAFLALIAGNVPAGAQISQDEVRRIREAAPETAAARPKQHRLLLVFNRAEGYRHNAIASCAQAIEILGNKTGAFETVQSDDYSAFLPENLRRFDAVCLNNTTQLKFEDPVLRKSLLDFVAGGKGIIGIHAATDNFPTWPEGQELMGGVFDGHPWTADGTWEVKITDAASPLTAAFGGKNFLLRDEIYRVRQIDLRKNSRVLVALDMQSGRNREVNGVRSSDKDIPISWVRTFGRGRLFYCSLGHNSEVYTNGPVLRHYLAGIQFALGDIQAETTPHPFEAMSFFDQAKLDGLLYRTALYQYGDSRAPLTELNTFIRWVDDIPAARLAMERQFVEFLKGGGTTAGKQFICQKLALLAGEPSVGTLAGMVADTTTADMALFALEQIPGPAADAALLEALKKSEGRTLIGVVTALGDRRVYAATGVVEPLVARQEALLAYAAVSSLGRIGTAEALAALERSFDASRGELRAAILDGMLACAERLRGEGAGSLALAAYRKLSAPGNSLPVRSAALRGIVLSDRANAASVIRETFRGGDRALHPAAAMLVREITDVAGLRAIASELSRLSPPTQIRLLASLAPCRDAQVQQSIVGLLTGRNSGVRIACLETLGAMGDADAVAPIARAASRASRIEQKVARASLAVLHASGLNDTVLALLPRAESKMKVELIKAIGERGIRSGSTRTVSAVKSEAGTVRIEREQKLAMPLVLEGARDPSRAVRVASARTLNLIAGGDDVPAMIELLVAARDELFRSEMERAIASASLRIEDPASRDNAILESYPDAKGKEARLSLIRILGTIGARSSLPLLRGTLKEKDTDIRRGGILALSSWASPEPFADLWPLATDAHERAERVLALRGAVRLIGLDTVRPGEETLRLYRDAMRAAPDVAEQKMILSALGNSRSLSALRLAVELTGNKDLRSEAGAAALNIAEGLPDSLRPESVPLVERVVAASADGNNGQRGKTLLAAIEKWDDFITLWNSAGPFGAQETQALDVPFGPELEGGPAAAWVPFTAGTDPWRPWLLELDRAFPGEDFVVYLRTNVWSPAEADGRLESSANYGVKIWWNGKLVNTSTAMRTIGWGNDAAPARVRKGWNTLMMKLEQGEHPWGACIRLRNSEGGRLEGIRVSTTEN
jgi:hypothetical protein